MGILFRPAGGRAGDFIPFFWKGSFHLFYLRVFNDLTGRAEGTPWHQVVTRDFVSFEDGGEAIPCGPVGSQDAWIFTGSVTEKDGVFYAFYTAHNRHFRPVGKPVEGVALATSTDLRHWTKRPEVMHFAPEGYEPHDWRDPFIYWDDRYKEFGMLLAARRTAGPSRRRGCVALMTSPDLKTWTLREPFWAPDQYFTHECPDLFKIGDWWYLVYSTFSDSMVTHYRMSRGLSGPWRAPDNPDGGDSFDSRAYYAAKTASDGKRRYAFGWLPTRDGEKDDARWNWGGTLVVHEVVQQPDGALTARLPDTVRAVFTKPSTPAPRPILGEWLTGTDSASAQADGRFSALSLGPMPSECLLEARAQFSPGTENFGFLLRSDAPGEAGYQVRFEPLRQRVVFDRWPRPGDQPFMLERPLRLRPHEPVSVQLLADGDSLVAYANDKVALSCRMYAHQQGEWGAFVTSGEARFEGLKVSER